jgi:hypothetical protein
MGATDLAIGSPAPAAYHGPMRWLACLLAIVPSHAMAARAVAADEPLPWSRGTLAPGVAIGVSPDTNLTSLSIGVGLDYYVGRGFSLGVSFSDELLVYSSSIRGRLPDVADQLPTNIFYFTPTARWVFFRRYRFSPYVFAGIGPALLNNEHGVVGHWQAGPSAYIGLVRGLFLDLGVVFSGQFPGDACNRAFVYRPPESSAGPVQVSECSFSWAPKIGIAYAFGFGQQRERREPEPEPEPLPTDPDSDADSLEDPAPPGAAVPPDHAPPPISDPGPAPIPDASPGPGPSPGS